MNPNFFQEVERRIEDYGFSQRNNWSHALGWGFASDDDEITDDTEESPRYPSDYDDYEDYDDFGELEAVEAMEEYPGYFDEDDIANAY